MMWLALYLYVVGVPQATTLAWYVSDKQSDDVVPSILNGILWPVLYPYGILLATLQRIKP